MLARVLGGILSLLSCSWFLLPTGLAQTKTPTPTIVINNSQVSNYAQAVLAIEPIRVRYYRQAQALFAGKVPTNACSKEYPETMPPGLDAICHQYFSESMQILQKYDLSPDEFNLITQQLRFSPSLYQRVQQEMIRHQQK